MPALRLFLLALPGILTAHRVTLPPHAAAGALFGLLLLHAAARLRASATIDRIALLLIPAVAALAAWETRTTPSGPPPPTGRTVHLAARLLGGVDRSGAAPVRITAGPGAGNRLLIRLPEGEEWSGAGSVLPKGTWIEAEGRFEPYPEPRNPYAPDRYAGERRRGGAGILRAESARVSGKGGGFLAPIAGGIRKRADRLGGEEGALYLALFLGDRSRLDPETVESFRETGLAHLLALSGLHLGIFYALLRVPLGVVPIPRRWVPVSAVALLWFFGAAAGFPVSLLRALVMASLLAIGRLLERRPAPGNALGVAALIALAFDPAAAGEVSFQLSFAATAGILAVLPLLRKLAAGPIGRYAAAPILVGAAAQTATLPAVLWHFGRFAPLGAAATAATAPALILALAAGSAWTTLGPVHPIADRLLEDAAWGSLALLRGAVGRWDHWGPDTIRLGVEDARGLALTVLLLAVVFRYRRSRAALFLLVGLSPLPVLLFHDPWPLRITVLDVGQGSAAVIETAEGERVAVDLGPRWGDFDAGGHVVLPFLRRRGAEALDLAVITHPDGDHMGGLDRLIEEGAIRRLLENGVVRADPAKGRSASAGDTGGVIRASALRGATHRFRCGAELRVLTAPEGRVPPDQSNASSLTLLLRYRRFTILFTGDATPEMERALRRSGEAKGITVLIASHHGARRGCALPFLVSARPAATIVSCGRNNRYGHPDRGVLARVERAGSALFRTDLHGGITIVTDGRRVRMRGRAAEAPRLERRLPFRPEPRGLFAGGESRRCDRIANRFRTKIRTSPEAP
ncbi:MAG: ComEC/Rec2 family competence protein [Candidatus Eisenbacteria bacterium]|nr:ComEC/Rec2 family competence protein [Candidatus Eisenbacteria bacterium]